MMSRTLVAPVIITPTLGENRSLSQTIDSRRQLVPNARHIICTPAAKVDWLKEQFPDCEVVADPGKGCGVFGAVDYAINKTVAPDGLFSFINDDDTLLAGYQMLLAKVGTAPRGRCAVWYGRVNMVSGGGEMVSEVATARFHWLLSHYYRLGIPPFTQQGAVISAEAYRKVGGFDVRLKISADTDLFRRMHEAGYGSCFVNASVATYCIRPGQLSSDREQLLAERRVNKRSFSGASLFISKVAVNAISRMLNIAIYSDRVRRHQTIELGKIIQKVRQQR